MIRTASLSQRLLLAAAAFITVAMILGAIAIGFVLHRFVQGQIDQRLDSQIVFLSSLLREAPDGSVSLAGDANGPPFDRPETGWLWQVAGARNILSSRSLEDAQLTADPKPHPPHPDPRHLDDGRPRPADGPGPSGRALHFRVLTDVPGAPGVKITVAAPRDAVIHPLTEAMSTLAISLALLGLALIVAASLQVRLGLRPLTRLRSALATVRAGEAAQLPADQPAEILPLVHDLNALFEQNAANLDRARRHVANLAHGLKTPLATLAIILADRERMQSPEAQALVTRMEQAIRHHLGRARIAALGGPVRVSADLRDAIADLLIVLTKASAERSLAVDTHVPPDFRVACEKQDLDEIVGNILENAFKWAAGRVTISARPSRDRFVLLTVEDDGPGLNAEQIATLVLPGRRLDETVPGYGFGLPIARELAELYGGSLTLQRSPLGGLCVVIALPAVVFMASEPKLLSRKASTEVAQPASSV